MQMLNKWETVLTYYNFYKGSIILNSSAFSIFLFSIKTGECLENYGPFGKCLVIKEAKKIVTFLLSCKTGS